MNCRCEEKRGRTLLYKGHRRVLIVSCPRQLGTWRTDCAEVDRVESCQTATSTGSPPKLVSPGVPAGAAQCQCLPGLCPALRSLCSVRGVGGREHKAALTGNGTQQPQESLLLLLLLVCFETGTLFVALAVLELICRSG